ncbi:MAG: tRNA lysidine(34) synthetase TilS [Oscillospiraceae bacterium]|nr:tRNA lysidine(34) synthetase TilS [Oscillospiraceae bacterium]
MLNKLCAFARRYDMLLPGEEVVCAVSGGADSVALLFALYLLKDKLGIRLAAAHFNHGLRGEESDRDEAFVRELCQRYDIPLHCGRGAVTAGKKGLEAAARDARYAFLKSLPGKIATAHTADDNAETVLMHLVRGTGLKGLGGIAPVNGRLIRPLLLVTREDVLAFIEEYNLSYVTDSSNNTDAFLRNRLRHKVMPLLVQENPRLAENLSRMALHLRLDEDALSQGAENHIEELKAMHPASRNRALAAFLEEAGVKEPDSEHIALAESLVFSQRPSAKADFPGGVTICRNYGKLERCDGQPGLKTVVLNCPGVTQIPELGLQVRCVLEKQPESESCFTVAPAGQMVLRSRMSGDEMRLHGGTKSLKKLFIDKKIPAARRDRIPVVVDDAGVLGVYGVGANRERIPADNSGVTVIFEPIPHSGE